MRHGLAIGAEFSWLIYSILKMSTYRFISLKSLIERHYILIKNIYIHIFMFVVFLMYALFPVAYPIAGILDCCLGEQHGTMYRKPGV